jgi:hypothetical protein
MAASVPFGLADYHGGRGLLFSQSTVDGQREGID